VYTRLASHRTSLATSLAVPNLFLANHGLNRLADELRERAAKGSLWRGWRLTLQTREGESVSESRKMCPAA
jgi:hypothetical protein